MQDSFDKKCVNRNDLPENVYGEKTGKMLAGFRGKA
jgi:hypothetical protein